MGSFQIGHVSYVPDLSVWYSFMHAKLHAKELLWEVFVSSGTVSSSSFPAGWKTLVCVLLQIKIIIQSVTGSLCGLLYHMSPLPCAISRQQEPSERWRSKPSIFCPPGVSRSSISLQGNMYWEELWNLSTTRSHPGGHISELRQHHCAQEEELLQFPSLKHLQFPSSWASVELSKERTECTALAFSDLTLADHLNQPADKMKEGLTDGTGSYF